MRANGGIELVGLKGHCYVLPIDSVEIVTTIVTTLPNRDLRKQVMDSFMGTPEMYKLILNVATRLRPLSMNPKNVFM